MAPQHDNIRETTLKNENLTAPTPPRMDNGAPIEKDFSNNGMHLFLPSLKVFVPVY